MRDWKTVKLGEIGAIIGGGTPSTSKQEYWDGDISWITPKDLSGRTFRYISKGNRSITELGFKESSTRMLPKGTVLLSSRAPIGYLAISEKELCTNQGFKSIVPDSEKINCMFLYYLLKSKVEYLISIGTGTTYPELSGTALSEVSVRIPPLPEQEAIAEVLSSLDDQIELLTKQNETLERIADTLFKIWFGTQSATYKTQKKNIGEIASISAGGDKPEICQDKASDNCDIPIFSNGVTNEGLFGFTNTAKIFSPSVTVSARGTIGFTCLRREPYYPIVRLISVTPTASVSAEYLYLWLKNIVIMGEGTTQEQLTVPMVKQYVVDVPSDAALEYFSKITNPIFDQIEANKKASLKLRRTRDALLPQLMSGALCVGDAKRVIAEEVSHA